MNIHRFENAELTSDALADVLLAELEQNPELKVCVATGSSPTRAYELWVQKILQKNTPTNNMTIIKLDEWVGLPMHHQSTCETYIRKHIINPLRLTDKQFISFNSQPANPELECKRIEKELARIRGIDVCVLGIGKNGHLGFNEPAEKWSRSPHIVKLSETSLHHNMLQGVNTDIHLGLTLDINNITSSKQVLVIVTGDSKADIIHQAFQGKVTPNVPASILQRLPHANIFLDKKAATKLKE